MTDCEQQKQIRDFIRRLNTREFRDVMLPEYALGKPLFDAVKTGIEGGRLSHHQTANGLAVLSRLRGFGEGDDVFDLFVTSLSHPHQRVRDKAVRLTIEYMRSQRWHARYYSPTSIDMLRVAAATALDEHSRWLINKLLERGPAAWEFPRLRHGQQ